MKNHTEWDNPWSHIDEYTDNNGEKYYKGSLFYHDIEFRFAVRPQQTGKYLYRGRVSAISPQTGKVMIMIVKDIESGEKKEQNVSAEINFNAIEEIKTRIQKSATRLYRENELLMTRELRRSVRPDAITPGCAAILHAKEHVDKEYEKAKISTVDKYVRQIQQHCSNLPPTPLAEYSAKYVMSYYKDNRIGKNIQTLLHKFGEFLLDKGYALGTNPFPEPPPRKPSPRARQNGVMIIKELTLEKQDALFDKIQSKMTPSGGDCGIALMVWGGFPADAGLTWGDIDIDSYPYAVATCRKKDYAGGTKNYDRVIFPQAAEILRRRYEHLCDEYSDNQLESMPIVSLVKDPKREMNSSALHQYAGMMLRKIGIGEATFAAREQGDESVSKSILSNTYKKNIELRIGMQSDKGRRKYLQALSLRGNTTDDNYTSFNDEDACECMYRAMLCMQPLRNLEQPKEGCHLLASGEQEFCYVPDTTREMVGLIAEIVVPPGEHVFFACPHGLLGRMKAREQLSDGTLKRKSGKKVVG